MLAVVAQQDGAVVNSLASKGSSKVDCQHIIIFCGMAELKKTASTASGAWETFWMAGEPFGPKFTLFCRIEHFVGNHALLTKVK